MIWIWILAFLIVICIILFAFSRVSKTNDFDDLVEMAENVCSEGRYRMPDFELVKSDSGQSRTLFFEKGPPRIELHETEDHATLRLVFLHELTHVLLDSEDHDRTFQQRQGDLTLLAMELGYLGYDAEVEDDYPCR
jgi:hypothetical protein